MTTPTSPTALLDRAQGCLLGLAIGDAMGAPVEFSPPGTFEPVTGFRAGGHFNLEAGQWTDDTSMALCLADSLLDQGGFDARDCMERFVRWSRHGENSSTGHCFDIGSGTRAALARFESTGDPMAGSPDGGGNGALMRMAPIPIFHHRDAEQAEAAAVECTRTTHGLPKAVDASRYFTRLLVRALNGADREALLATRFQGDAEVEGIAQGRWKRGPEGGVRGNGYCLDSMEAALWAFGTTHSFADCVLAAVNLGEDADTVGAIAGQIAGACYGLGGIPEEWVEGVWDGGRLLGLAGRLVGAG